MRTFRAATLNIWSRFGPWEERLVAIREGLRTIAPDVIGMQEVLRHEGFDQAAMVSDGLGTGWTSPTMENRTDTTKTSRVSMHGRIATG